MMIHKFHCDYCDKDKTHESTTTTGYGEYAGKKACFDCCAILDKQRMDEVVANCRAGRRDKTCLYLTIKSDGAYVTNWPGTLSIKCRNYKRGGSRFRTRYDAWFVDHRGRLWHGVNSGDMQIIHCRPMKA